MDLRRARLALACLAPIIAVSVAAPQSAHAAAYRTELNLVPAPPQSAPPASSVMFSTRFERPEAPSVAAAFGATHLVWLYPKSRDYLRQLTSAHLAIGTTLNANQAVPEEGLARNLEGAPLVAPWMQSWGARWISVSSPATRSALLDAAQRHITWGAQSIQFDDPALATASFGWGGDFSKAALENFGRWLAGPGVQAFPELAAEMSGNEAGNFDYRAWLGAHGITTTSAYLKRRTSLPFNAAWERFHLEEVRSFFETLRTGLHADTRPARLDLNLTNPRPDARTFQLIDLADGVMSETSASDLANAALSAATVQSTGAIYLPSLQPHDVTATRRQIAGFYALGALPLVPWDVYMPDLITADKQRVNQPRYFGTAAEYADLYRFVRAQPSLFDGRESLATVLVVCQVEHFKPAEVLDIVRRLQARQIPFALMVARSGYPARTLDANRMERAPAVVFASAFSGLDAASEAALKSAESRRLRVTDLDTARARLAPVSVTSDAPVLVLPRVDPARPEELIVHLVRNDSSASAKEMLSVHLDLDLMPWHAVEQIEVFSPTHPAPTRIAAKGPDFNVPFEGDWAILRVRLHQ